MNPKRAYFDPTEYPQERIYDLEEMIAVWNGEVMGDYYDSDHETWAELASLEAWRAQRRVP